MKRNLIITLIAAFATASSFSQVDVKLNITHLMGTEAFAPLKASKTPEGEEYNAYRLEYYMSGFKLEHDGGQITEVDSVWLLIDAEDPKVEDLGTYDITDLEAIHFSIGIDSATNYLDPASWPADHPLNYQDPSMHWGWFTGYRFFCIEGYTGSDLEYKYELHSLFQKFYFPQRIETAGSVNGSELTINLNANYDELFRDMTMGNGFVEHGAFEINILHLSNVRNYLFKSDEGNGNSMNTVGLLEAPEMTELKIFPNPSSNGVFHFSVNDAKWRNAEIEVLDYTGRIVKTESIDLISQGTITIDSPGSYIIRMTNNEGEVKRAVVLVQ